MKIALLFMMLTLAGCVSDNESLPAETQTTTNWEFAVTRSNYTEGVQIFMGQLGAYTVELQGTVYAPNASEPDLVLIMHGRHGTCAVLGSEQLAPHCPETPVTSAVPSMHGYDAFGYALAKKGFFVVSVDANGVNGLDLAWGLIGDDSGATARANVLQAHYDHLRANYDLSGKVGLIGHSRGGEAVNLAAETLTPSPEAIYSIAPTDFADHDVGTVPFLVVLPECDGDVSDLQGMDVYSRNFNEAGPRYQVWVAGANHNFFNTVWTTDDAGFRYNEGLCADNERRLAMAEQTQLGADMATSFFQKHMHQMDDGALEPMQCAWDCPTVTHLLRNGGFEHQLILKNWCKNTPYSQGAGSEYSSVSCTGDKISGLGGDFAASAADYKLKINGLDYSDLLQFSTDPSHKKIFRTLEFGQVSELSFQNLDIRRLTRE